MHIDWGHAHSKLRKRIYVVLYPQNEYIFFSFKYAFILPIYCKCITGFNVIPPRLVKRTTLSFFQFLEKALFAPTPEQSDLLKTILTRIFLTRDTHVTRPRSWRFNNILYAFIGIHIIPLFQQSEPVFNAPCSGSNLERKSTKLSMYYIHRSEFCSERA